MTTLPLFFLLPSILGAVLAGFVCSTMGTFVVRMNLSSIGYCMSHAAFAGAAFGILISIDPMISAVLFAFATALVLGPLSEKARLESNVVIGFLFSVMIALGFIFLSLKPGEAATGRALSILWGSLFSVNYDNVLLLSLLSFALLVFVIVFYKELVAVMFHRKLAESAGINTKMFYFAVLFFTGFAVALSLKLVGGLLVFALIVNPTSTAYQFFYDFKKIMIISPVIGILSCLLGFYLSLIADFPIGAAIVIVSATGFAVSLIVSPKRKKGFFLKSKQKLDSSYK
ncbi:MAG: metal ABC transporter permease [Candidatus Thermoplasmatota archaeon]|nr:metal ABC transporter permease [Candidatus Thermoplasmatota archaeon]MBS3802383.1 metal ABC transporter permease [Candidatus Thermoplasmatota archaeon]